MALDGIVVKVLTVNAGSSTLKLSLMAEDGTRLGGQLVEVDDVGAAERALHDALAELERPDAVGHRVVHGGAEFTGPVLLDDAVRSRLESFVELAPLHQPGALAGIDLVGKALPDLPAVACFDTAFHTTLSEAASTYALPPEWRGRGIRRYGFHGLSHAYSARRAGEMLGSRPSRLVICHLGAGASLSAVLDGRCVDTTMGFTPLEGLVMATRSGDVDPGLLTWLQRRHDLTPTDLEAGLN
ncbi:MAG TPA: acetate/propionate family kinase, partial [Actinopolymorphaceae bacterium]